MKLVPTPIDGALVAEPEPIADERGYFARTFDQDVFRTAGLEYQFPQWSISQNRVRGTVRGMHYQVAPWEEAKLVGCARGAIYDVLLDLRPGSLSFKRWTAIEIRAASPRLVYIPKGVAHGFQTLEDDTLVTYQISEPFRPDAARGVCWNDEAFGLQWPVAVTCISERDRGYPAWR